MHHRALRAFAVLGSLAFLVLLDPAEVRADAEESPYSVAAAAGFDSWVTPELGGHGFVLADVRRREVANGTFHLLFNTETLQVGLEGIRLLDGKLEIGIVARGEALWAGVLINYFVQGIDQSENGFHASYAQLLPLIKWHLARYHSLEAVLGLRQWFFGRNGDTADDLSLPPEAFVFEPRIRYTFWKIRAPASEWEAHRLFPRIEGVAFGITLGLDLRSDHRAWGGRVGGVLDPRNDPDRAILMVRQWLRAGFTIGSHLRAQIEQHGSWGEGEDDLSRNRAGGLSPYVVPLHGLPWPALLSERLLAARASLHVVIGDARAHEVGVDVTGGAFNDVYRVGDLDRFGGAGGLGAFADLRFGAFQLYGRAGWAFPADWLLDPPHLGGLLALGYRFL